MLCWELRNESADCSPWHVLLPGLERQTMWRWEDQSHSGAFISIEYTKHDDPEHCYSCKPDVITQNKTDQTQQNMDIRQPGCTIALAATIHRKADSPTSNIPAGRTSQFLGCTAGPRPCLAVHLTAAGPACHSSRWPVCMVATHDNHHRNTPRTAHMHFDHRRQVMGLARGKAC